jgi:adenosylcobinamide kinase/adenosylcobinamide-phosphate guanylyltransferase
LRPRWEGRRSSFGRLDRLDSRLRDPAGSEKGARVTRAKSITLILGGARSGKSRLAQKLAAGYSPVVFVATAQPSDDEMRRKIERHKAERPAEWFTIEEPLRLETVLQGQGSTHSLLLIDCLTLYTSNLMTAERNDPEAVLQRAALLSEALKSVDTSVILVSNEVGSGIVPMHPAGRMFRDLLGEINQRVAAVADNVLVMVAGLPLVVKGQLEARA